MYPSDGESGSYASLEDVALVNFAGLLGGLILDEHPVSSHHGSIIHWRGPFRNGL